LLTARAPPSIVRWHGRGDELSARGVQYRKRLLVRQLLGIVRQRAGVEGGASDLLESDGAHINGESIRGDGSTLA